MESVDARRAPPFWRHDGYTLDCLQKGIREAISVARLQANIGIAPASVVDIGAGSAPYRALFEELGAKYVTCDMEGGNANHDSSLPDVKIVPGQTIDIESKSANWVVSFQVLEHVWDLDWYLGECRRILKDDGVLILSLPVNANLVGGNLFLFLGGRVVPAVAQAQGAYTGNIVLAAAYTGL